MQLAHNDGANKLGLREQNSTLVGNNYKDCIKTGHMSFGRSVGRWDFNSRPPAVAYVQHFTLATERAPVKKGFARQELICMNYVAIISFTLSRRAQGACALIDKRETFMSPIDNILHRTKDEIFCVGHRGFAWWSTPKRDRVCAHRCTENEDVICHYGAPADLSTSAQKLWLEKD